MIKIGNRKISLNSKPLIVAEIGINHFGSLKLAKKIVDNIKKCGAEAVKVQIHIPNEEMSEEAKKIKPGNSNKNIFSIIKENSLNLDEELKLKNYIENNNIEPLLLVKLERFILIVLIAPSVLILKLSKKSSSLVILSGLKFIEPTQ